MEGNYDEVMQLIAHIKNSALKGDSEEIIINLKLHCNSKKSLFIDDKIGQYQS
ncbi:MAG: thiamine-binding protein [Bacteroidota bacterium]